ncbi:hypothetical protein PITCH_A1820017 [uncultured Desulfobacterium sp.]|uniref:Uncharacterized protein n=1 Tax=uncultured Desulfobacterium sp. TaxID=201089 RepID=A0A445MV97_9BACT|nr:hypothetical protein PITCH_A1820017 [uncultured Desulfobacterium sp.]
MAKAFRILVVDDKKPVLEAMKDWIEHNYNVANEDYRIELLLLHVDVLGEENEYQISVKTFEKLNEYCQKPFNLILADFGFVKQGINTIEELDRLKVLNPKCSVRELIDRIILNPSHIVNDCIRHPKYYKRIKKQFVDFKGNLYVYTYIPSKIEREYTSADVRKNVTNKHFPSANILLIDARKELFNNSKFDGKHDGEYYPFLISKYLSKIIHIEIAELTIRKINEVKDQFVKLKRNNRIVTITTILPSIIAGVFIPSLFTSIEKGNYTIAIAFLLMLVCIVGALTLLPRWLESTK